MVTKEKIKELVDYHIEYFDEETINELMKEFEFDKSRLEDSNLRLLSEDELFNICFEIVYFLIEGLGIDFGTMYDVLYEVLGFEKCDVNELLDW